MSHVPPGSIVVGVDGSTGGDSALLWAADEAAARNVPLHLIRARDDDGFWIRSGVGQPSDVVARPDSILGSRILLAQERHPDLAVTHEAPGIGAAAALIERSRDAVMVVIGSRGRGTVRGTLLGSVSREVSAHALCPVAVVPGESHLWRDQAGLVIGVDGSPGASAAAQFAFAHAADRAQPLTALAAWWGADAGMETDAARLLSETLAPWREKHPDVVVRERVVQAHAVDALVAASAAARLIVVGARGAGGFAGLRLGAVSHRLLQRAHCPVVVVCPPRES